MISPVTKSPNDINPWPRRLMPLAAILLSLILAYPLAIRLEPVLGDALVLQNQKEIANAADDIVIVAITEETLAQFPYRSPIDRGFLAELVSDIDSRSPKKIGVDILLDAASDPRKDQELFSVLKSAEAPVILASADRVNGLTDKQIAYLDSVLADHTSGSIVLQRDTLDGVVRHLPNLVDETGKQLPSFAELLAGSQLNSGDHPGRILYQVNADAEGGGIPKYPAHTISVLPRDWFADKIVLIGTDLPNTDRHLIPGAAFGNTSNETLAGIEVHAQILKQISQGRSLPVFTGWQIFLLTAFAAVISVMLLSATSKPGRFFAGLALIVCGYLFATVILATREIVLIPIIGPPFAAVFAALLYSLSRWWRDRAERQFLETAFAQYVSQSVVKRLTSGNIKLSLGSEKRMVTYLFTDLEGFTTLSQSIPPDQIGPLLNAYLDKMCDLITAHGATIDKIIGDAVVCFFGAPDDDRNQAVNGLKLALALDEFCERYRQEANERSIPLGVTRIGLHMGEAIVGNFGGKRFFDYTGIGDTVNIAARLEGANRHLGTRICVSCAIESQCKDHHFRPLGELVLKGRSSAIACFEPCLREKISAPWMQVYLKGYRQLEDGDQKSSERFEEVLALNPEDGPARFHLDRLKKGPVDAKVTLWEK